VVVVRVEVERLYVDERGFTRVLARVESESRPGVWYGVYVWMRGGEVVAANCTCPGHTFRKHCKHVEWVRSVVLQATAGPASAGGF
jgi:uncharacterized Zn finger protein